MVNLKEIVARKLLIAALSAENLSTFVSHLTNDEVDNIKKVSEEFTKELNTELEKREVKTVRKPYKLSFDEEVKKEPELASFLNKPSLDRQPVEESYDRNYIEEIVRRNSDLFENNSPKVVNSNYYGNGIIPETPNSYIEPKYKVETSLNNGVYSYNYGTQKDDIDPSKFDIPEVYPKTDQIDIIEVYPKNDINPLLFDEIDNKIEEKPLYNIASSQNIEEIVPSMPKIETIPSTIEDLKEDLLASPSKEEYVEDEPIIKTIPSTFEDLLRDFVSEEEQEKPQPIEPEEKEENEIIIDSPNNIIDFEERLRQLRGETGEISEETHKRRR